MPNIRPISDLRNRFAEITQEAETTQEPVFLTRNGTGCLVVMSMDAYENYRYENEVYDKLCEAEVQAASTSERFSHEEVLSRLRKMIGDSDASDI